MRPMVLKWVYENVSEWSPITEDHIKNHGMTKGDWCPPPDALKEHFYMLGDRIKMECGYSIRTVTIDVCNTAWRHILKMVKEPWYKEYTKPMLPTTPRFLTRDNF